MIEPTRQPGWDKQAINKIAREEYGGLNEMFAAHGWHKGDRVVSQIAPTRVVETYGSVEAFVEAYKNGSMRDPLAAIERDPPNVWLTSFYGFAPRNWGFLGFSVDWMRERFLRETRPGVLVVIYGASGASADETMKVLGIQQMSHETGSAQDFMEPRAWAIKQADRDRRDKWNLAVRAVRAWRVTPESRPTIQDFADETYSSGRGQVIGSQGMRLTANEARKILDLDLVEVPVFGADGGMPELAGPATQILRPSRPGPVAQAAYMVREAEGPKHLYVLRLEGNGEHFMGRDVQGQAIVKVGFSRSPQTRCSDHNRVLPNCAFRWAIAHSTFDEGLAAYPSSRHALAGEQEMKDVLERWGESLGGEFFLADMDQVGRAWERAKRKAQGVV